MAKQLLVVLFLACIHVAVSQDEEDPAEVRCRFDEDFIECGSACPPTCATRNQPPGPCIAVCRSGCFCKPGLLRDSDGRCVRPSECKEPPRPFCRPDEVFMACGPSCPRRCASRGRPPCPDVCRRGCFCKSGFIRDLDGNCILPSQCPRPRPTRICGRNEFFSTCLIPCDDCTAKKKCRFSVCNIGCMCKPGFFRNRVGICILERDCPRVVY